MSWENHGRQEHGWFGHGTAPPGEHPPLGGAGAMFAPGNFPARIDAIAHAALAHLPRADWWRGAASFDQERLAQLRAAADGARQANTHPELAAASAELAGAMRGISLDRWTRFLRDVAARAEADGPANGRVMRAQATHPNTAMDRPALSRHRGMRASGAGGDRRPTLYGMAAGRAGARQHIHPPGTAIATFDEFGRYTGHTAIYLGQDERGIWVIDQWNNWQDGRIASQQSPNARLLPFGDSRRAFVNRGESYHVVE